MVKKIKNAVVGICSLLIWEFPKIIFALCAVGFFYVIFQIPTRPERDYIPPTAEQRVTQQIHLNMCAALRETIVPDGEDCFKKYDRLVSIVAGPQTLYMPVYRMAYGTVHKDEELKAFISKIDFDIYSLPCKETVQQWISSCKKIGKFNP